ncbi:MAG: DUF3990 domain-containing protein [Bacteroidales bacterium]|jgi:hypothetical protein|nr:DUF3990 domain-containing protein [Bacteroidales bacterium]
MKVYHGSYTKIDKIDLSKCDPRKDFGQGFYVTKFREQAVVWANRKGRDKHTEGVITEFTFFENAFADPYYKTLRFESYDDKWLDFVAINRHFNTPLPAHDFDIVEGPVADDKITTRIDAYMRGEVSREDFLQELTFDAPSHQICFCSVKSLLMLEQVVFKGITAIERISENVVEKLVVDLNISTLEATDLFYNSDTYTKLSDLESDFCLKSWPEIYELLTQDLKK